MRGLNIIFLIVPLFVIFFALLHYFIFRCDTTSYSLSSEIAIKSQLDEEKADLKKILTMKKRKDILAYIVTCDLPNTLEISITSNILSTKYEDKFENISFSFKSIKYLELSPKKWNQNTDRIDPPKFINLISVNDGHDVISIMLSESPYVVTNLDLFIKNEAKLFQKKIYSYRKKIQRNILKKSPFGFWDFLYFTVITSTTVGFGDISPVSKAAQFVTMANSITGLIMYAFLGTFIYDRITNAKKFIKQDGL